VALNWVRQQPGVVIPIIGAKRVSQLEDNLGCLNFTLTAEQLAQLNDISKIELGFPYDFLTSEQVQDLVFGGTYSKIDNHRA
jgi:diketogulonate reductase-like aldo/keto reductase